MEEHPDPVIVRELSSGERLLWWGRPTQSLLVLRTEDLVMIPFSLAWGGGTLVILVSTMAREASVARALYLLPFVFLGLYLMFGRFLVDFMVRAGTFYAVTSERVVLINTVLTQRVRSLSYAGLTSVTLLRYSGGRGTITFEPFRDWPGFHVSNFALLNYGHPHAPRLERIPAAREVYELIRQLQREARPWDRTPFVSS